VTLFAIFLGTLAAGVGSVWLAALLSFGALGRYTQHMLSMAAGALMATAFMHLLPEAFESGIEPRDLFLALLIGLVFFFLLDKAELWHHGHEHHHGEAPAQGAQHDQGAHAGHDHPEHAHAHGHEHGEEAAHAAHAHNGHAPKGGSWAVLAGDSVHCFGDGMLIASAFIADLRLGAIASLAVLAHEVPHHMGDLMVLRTGTSNKRAALIKVSLAGAVTALGGVLGFWLVDQLHNYLPYFLVVASSSFIYVALADLIPQLQKQLSTRQTAAQIAWLVGGIVLVTVMSSLGEHAH
jgi:zinc and cadmium transporter